MITVVNRWFFLALAVLLCSVALTATAKQNEWRLDEGQRIETIASSSSQVLEFSQPVQWMDGAPGRWVMPPWTATEPPRRMLFGLAQFYNHPRPLLFQQGEVVNLSEGQTKTLSESDWVGWKDRTTAILAAAPGATVALASDRLSIQWDHDNPGFVRILNATDGAGGNVPTLADLRYAHLWNWLAAFCRLIETILGTLYGLLGSWGWAIITLAVLTRALLLPVNLLALKFQRDTSAHQSILEPKLQAIKQNFDGEEAHNRIMNEYKALGITPFHTLKPMLGALIQIPILVGVFNVLGEHPDLHGQAFGWIKDLAYPDTMATLPVSLPNFANQVNLLPILMTIVALVATFSYRNRLASARELGREKRKLVLMAAAFFVLFYPFPAAMVLYWTAANALQLMQQQMVKI